MWGICRPLIARMNRPTVVRFASSSLRMPAMSPTMTEGGIAGWKKQEGEEFTAGDVLLEIETDKATIDVEAQDDGIMGKIISPSGSQKIPVGQIIAILAEEGDDISSLTVPEDLSPPDSSTPEHTDSSSSPSPSSSASPTEKKEQALTPSHDQPSESPTTQENSSSPKSGEPSKAPQNEPQAGITTEKKAAMIAERGQAVAVIGHGKGLHAEGSARPLFPSVMRLLAEANLSSSEINSIKATGRNGMLTKGDVLFHLGKIENARGSMKGIAKTSYGTTAGYGDNGTQTGAGVGPGAKAGTGSKGGEALTGLELRRAILAGLEKASLPSKGILGAASPLAASASFETDFQSLLAPYESLFPTERKPAGVQVVGLEEIVQEKGSRVGGKKDEWDGLF